LAWYTLRTNYSQRTVDTLNGVKMNVGAVRDAKTSDPVVKYLAVGRQLGYAFYMLLDNLTYPDVSGIRKFEAAARLQKEAYRAWAVGLACNVVAGVYALYNLRVAEQRQEGSADAEKAVEVKKLAKYVGIEHTCALDWFANDILLGTRALPSSSSSPTCAI
jgi:peroxin-11B